MPELESMTRDVVAEQFEKLGGSLSQEAVEPATDAGGEPDPAAAAEPERAAPGTGRDEKGRFAAKAPDKAAAADAAVPGSAQEATAGAVAAATAAAPALPELKPPQDWRAEARAEFAKLPRVVQEEANRLYAETRKTLDRAATLEKEAGAWKEATGAYSHVFAGQPAHQVVGNLLGTLAALQGGHPQQRAAIVADIVRNYIGTDEQALRLLGMAIDGSGPARPSAQPQALAPEQVRQLARQEWETAQQEQTRKAAVATWQSFEAANSEFLNEPGFRQRVALELQLALGETPGTQPTREMIQKAYDAACQSHPGVAKIVNQRKEAEAAGKANASTQARTAAAVGIKNEPAVAGSTSEPAGTVREEVQRQYARLANKRR